MAHDRGIGIQGARDTFDLDWRRTMTLIQIGCGQSPIAGWVNYDNSPSVRLAKLPPALIQLAGRLKLLDRQSIAYVSSAAPTASAIATPPDTSHGRMVQ
jgi:hypothetical protein